MENMKILLIMKTLVLFANIIIKFVTFVITSKIIAQTVEIVRKRKIGVMEYVLIAVVTYRKEIVLM